MDEPDTPPLTEKDAEAALLALGPQLAWKDDSQDPSTAIGIGANGAFYIVRYLASHFRNLPSRP